MQKYNKTWKLNYWGDDPGEASEILTIKDNRVVICDPNYLCDFANEQTDLSEYMRQNGVLMWNDVGGSIIVDGGVILIGNYDELSVGEIIEDEIGGDSGSIIAFSINGANKEILKQIPQAMIFKGVPNGQYRPYVLDGTDSPYIRMLA